MIRKIIIVHKNGVGLGQFVMIFFRQRFLDADIEQFRIRHRARSSNAAMTLPSRLGHQHGSERKLE